MRKGRGTNIDRLDGWLSGFGGPARSIVTASPAIAALVFLAVLFWPATQETPPVIRIGVLPDQSEEALRDRYAPLLAYLAAETGVPFELVVPDSYEALLEKFYSDEVDLAYFGGFTFLKARQTAGARGLVMRDVDSRFRSSFLARADRPEVAIADFRGATLAFGSPLSTSGHLMPRYFLQQDNIDPDTWFANVVYSGSHDATAYLVRDGKADLGAANAEIIEAMYRDGRLNRDEVRVVRQSPPYTNYVWATRSRIGDGLRQDLTDAFLKLSPAEPEHAAILERLGAGGFLPVQHEELKPLKTIAISLDLLGNTKER